MTLNYLTILFMRWIYCKVVVLHLKTLVVARLPPGRLGFCIPDK